VTQVAAGANKCKLHAVPQYDPIQQPGMVPRYGAVEDPIGTNWRSCEGFQLQLLGF